jgi:hypothetical protein
MQITRDVISDLWPLYAAGEATADTRALVDAFLASDPEFARTLKSGIEIPATPIVPQPNSEARAFQRTRDLVRGNSWMRGIRMMALVFTIFAMTRILSDTTFTASPRPFIGNAIGAVITWTIYCVWLYRARRRALTPPAP